MFFHLSAILAFRLFTIPTGIQRNNRLCNAEFFAAEPMVMFAIISCVSKKSFKLNKLTGLNYRRSKLWRIVIRASCDNTADKQVSFGVANSGYLGPMIAQEAFVAFSADIISIGMTAFLPWGHHRRNR